MVSSEKTIPDFVIVGAMKAGTTSMADILRGHPQIFIPALKEPNHFCDLENTFAFPHRAPSRLDYAVQTEAEYRALFSEAGNRLTGEATAQYFVDPASPGADQSRQSASADHRLFARPSGPGLFRLWLLSDERF